MRTVIAIFAVIEIISALGAFYSERGSLAFYEFATVMVVCAFAMVAANATLRTLEPVDAG